MFKMEETEEEYRMRMAFILMPDKYKEMFVKSLCNYSIQEVIAKEIEKELNK